MVFRWSLLRLLDVCTNLANPAWEEGLMMLQVRSSTSKAFLLPIKSFLTIFQNSTNTAHQKHTRKIKAIFYSKWDLPVAWAASWVWGQTKAAETRSSRQLLFLRILSTLLTFLMTQLRLLLFQKHENHQPKHLFPHLSFWDQKTQEYSAATQESGQRFEGKLPMALPMEGLLHQINKSTDLNLIILESFRNTTLTQG